MKKIFSLFAAILFAGSMMAADAKLTLNFTSNGVPGQNNWKLPTDYNKAAATYTYGGSTISFSTSDNGHKALINAIVENKVATGDTIWQGIIFGKQNAALSFPALSFNVSKIVVYWVSAQGSSAVVHNIYVENDAVSTAVTGCQVTATADSSVFLIDAAKQAAGTIYTLKVTSKHNMQVSKVEFYEAVAGAPENPTFSVAGGVYDAAQSVELACATTGAEIFYTLDGTEPSSASTKYTSALNITSNTTIKAIAIKNSISSAIVTAEYKIISLEGDGSKNNPYTIADVVALENSRPDTAWVKGYILGGMKNDGTEIDNTNPSILALGATADASVTDAIPVQLVFETAPRAALNAKDNAGNIGKLVYVHGALQLYCNKTGVKGTNDYFFPAATSIFNAEANEQKAQKIIENGQLFIIKNGVKYNAQGIEVR